MDFSKTLFRCSSLGHLMTLPKSKADRDAGNLSESAKTHLVDIYVSAKYGRKTDIHNKYIQKGLMVEEDGITLYSRLNKTFYKKNETHLSNEFIKGTPDLYTGEVIDKAKHIVDIKSSYDIFTFFRNLNNPLNNLYWWQVQGYMDLTGAETASVAYCLIDTPEILINEEKRRLMWRMGVATDENTDFKEACEEIDRLLTYADIPLEQRKIEFMVKRDQEAIDNMHNMVLKGRAYLAEIEHTLTKNKFTGERKKRKAKAELKKEAVGG